MAGQGGPLRPPQLPQNPWEFLLASLPQPGTPPLPPRPTMGAAPRPAPFAPPNSGPAPAPTAVDNWTDPQQLAQALQDLTRGLWSYGTHPAESFGKAAQGGAQAAQGLWEMPTRAPEIAQALGQAGPGAVAQGMGDYLGERFGSPTQAVQTALQDPFGALMDLPIDPVSPGMLAAGVAAAPARGFRLPATAAIKTQKAAGIKGMYSRSVRAAEQLPERVNVQSVLNALQRFGAPPEELRLTRLAESLPKSGQVERAEVIRRLEANLPKLDTTERIKSVRVPADLRAYLTSRKLPVPANADEWSQLSSQLRNELDDMPPISNAEEDAAWTALNEARYGAQRVAGSLRRSRGRRRNYEQYTLPGGGDYQETLLTANPVAEFDPAQWTASLSPSYSRYLPDLAQGEAWDPDLLRTAGFVVRDPFGNPIATRYANTAEQAVQETASMRGGGTYRGGHWQDTPNVLMHTRTKTRRLADAPLEVAPVASELDPDPGFAAWMKDNYHYVRPDQWDQNPGYLREYNQHLQDQAVKAASSQGPEGHFVEEIQSDWMHEGQREGFRKSNQRYDMVAGPEFLVRAMSPEGVVIPIGPISKESATARAAELHAKGYQVEMVPHKVPKDLAEQMQLEEQLQAVRQQISDVEDLRWSARHMNDTLRAEELQAQKTALQAQYDTISAGMDASRQRINALRGGDTPQPPYEKEWENIALKRELLKAADEGAEWFGMTSGKSQADRYNLLNYVDTVTYDPATQSLIAFKDGSQIASHTVDASKLGDYVGTDVAKKLLAQQGDTVAAKPSRVDYEYDEDTAQRSLERLKAENPTTSYAIQPVRTTQYGEEKMRYDIMENAAPIQAPHVLRGDDLAIGNQHLQRLYDEQLPRKLSKIVEKFGGKVERGLVRITKGTGTEPAWIVRLPPELRKRLLTEGLPLMSLAPFLAAELRGKPQ